MKDKLKDLADTLKEKFGKMRWLKMLRRQESGKVIPKALSVSNNFAEKQKAGEYSFFKNLLLIEKP